MLEWISTPYGEVVPKFNGALLASKIDPFKEARTWVAHNRLQIESAEKHFILGIGSGHHVMELAMQFPEKEFVCFEFLEGLSFSSQYAQIRALTNVEIIIGSSEKTALKNERVQKILTNVFTLLKHHQAIQTSPDFYQRLEEILIGHNWKAFNQILKLRPREDSFLNEMNFSPKLNVEFTAKDIIDFIENKEGDRSDTEMIWMTLGELIK